MDTDKNYLLVDQITSSGVLIAKVWGEISIETVHQLLGDLHAIEHDYPQGFQRFTDLSAVRILNLSTDEIRLITDKRRSEYQGPAVRSAIYAPDPLAYGTMRMYASMIDPSPIEVGVFYSMEESAKWVGQTLAKLEV